MFSSCGPDWQVCALGAVRAEDAAAYPSNFFLGRVDKEAIFLDWANLGYIKAKFEKN